ncbi:hypothetical protein [Streptomyces sp. NPDC018045]|uniref:hypothetical protein n=1 Tax=Streptomyces sp. NPDC018045 TaxID=3365037 RepID=UPI0037B12740
MSMASSRSTTARRALSGSGSASSQGRFHPAPASGPAVGAVIGQDRVQGTQPHELGPVAQHGALLAYCCGGDPRLGQRMGPQ